MHNISFIRDNPVIFDNAMKQRGENSISKKKQKSLLQY